MSSAVSFFTFITFITFFAFHYFHCFCIFLALHALQGLLQAHFRGMFCRFAVKISKDPLFHPKV